ncbi:hypothetical protein POM88_035606 [Heracleum sosnowskyi]|uniref:F-box domain-containing protein n=1 Tax=Heracleum sosnowskyi TaxID=360622 RepID=A0AAD8ME88_9APIA|nr:hypothetical protein POM88_035606 [Heracleum sosnowskyi]
MSKKSYPAASKELKLSIPNQISDDLLYEIFIHLPVETLLRFKSVCKTWLALISSPCFVKSHLATAAASDDQIHIAHSYDYDNHNDTYFVLIDVVSRETADYLDLPFSMDKFPYMPNCIIFGSACGVVSVLCILNDDKYAPIIYLWNPATRLSKRIRSCDFKTKYEALALGFNYDSISNDFKVVTVVLPSYSAAVYSANTNVWRNINPNPIDFPVDCIFDVCVDGILCAAGSHGMIAFDLNAEVFNCGIKFPAPIFDESITEFSFSDHHATITKYNASIAAIIRKRSDYDCKINLWSLDDEACLRGGGICPSWTLRLNIIVNQPVQYVHGYFSEGDFLLVNSDDVWFLYNPNNEEADLCIRRAFLKSMGSHKSTGTLKKIILKMIMRNRFLDGCSESSYCDSTGSL